jgi:hypothetical protein
MMPAFAPVFADTETCDIWNAYFADVDRLVRLIGPGAAELSEDLRAHLTDSFASEEGPGGEAERLQRAIDRLGRPADFLRPMLADELIDRGTAKGSILLISRGLYHAVRSGSGRALRAAVFALGYVLLGIFAVMTVLKPFFGNHIGLIRGADGSLTFGMVSQDGGQELLGLWSVPLTLALCGLLYMLLTRMLRRTVRTV